MIKLYDKKMNYIGNVSHKNLQITEELGTGYKTAQFLVPYTFGFLQEEQKVEIDKYLYSIKEVNMERNDYYEVFCKPCYGQLAGKRIDSLTGYNMNLKQCLDSIVEDTDWTYAVNGEIAGSFTLTIQYKTALETLDYLKGLYQFEYFIDTYNKVIEIWNKRGEYKESFFLNNNNIRECKVQSDTYDLITRLIPIGKDQTTISLVNNNCLWIDDFSYTDDVIIGYYINTSVKNADDLLSIAKAKLEEIARPHTSYKIKAKEFTNTLEVGDTVRVVDEIKGLNKVLRVQKKVVSDEGYYEIGDSRVSFDDIYKSLKEAQKHTNDDVLRSLTEISKGY